MAQCLAISVWGNPGQRAPHFPPRPWENGLSTSGSARVGPSPLGRIEREVARRGQFR